VHVCDRRLRLRQDVVRDRVDRPERDPLLVVARSESLPAPEVDDPEVDDPFEAVRDRLVLPLAPELDRRLVPLAAELERDRLAARRLVAR
jgi:hypothetical protein